MEEDAAPLGQREGDRTDSAGDGLGLRTSAHRSALTCGGFLENGTISVGVSGRYWDVIGRKGVA